MRQFGLAAVTPRPRATQVGTVAHVWNGALDLDFSRALPAIVLAFVFVVARIPWLPLGYGADPDAWRVAISARYLLDHGSYLPSRLPGYPVHDIAMAALVRGGWTLTNAASVAVALAGVFLFARIVHVLCLPKRGLLTVTFAFLPLLWSTSTATLDYSWALTLLLGAYLAQLGRRPVLAGLLLGLAGGCRISYLAFGLPVGLLLWRQGGGRSALRFAAAMGAIWLAVFAPVWLRYGTRFWDFYDVRPSWGDFFHAIVVDGVGWIPLFVLAGAFAVSWRQVLSFPTRLRDDPQAAASAMIVLITLAIYVRLPLQTYYLMPAAPFALLLLPRLLRPSMLIVACAGLLAGGVVDVYTASTTGWRSADAFLKLRPTPGLILRDYQLRRDRLALVRRVRGIDLPDHSVLSTGFYFPMVAELYHGQLRMSLPDGYLTLIGPLTDDAQATDSRDVVYVWILQEVEARNLIRRGYRIYSLNSSRETGDLIATPIYRAEYERFGIH